MNHSQVISSRVALHNGRATLFLNDAPTVPVIYSLTDVPGGRWSWEEIPQHNIAQFAARGVKLFQLDLALDFIWREDGTVSVETAQKQIRGVLHVCADAAVFFRLHVRPPKWWMKKYPEENTTYFDGKAIPDIEGGLFRLIEEDAAAPTRTSLASQKWRDECEPIVRQFCREFAQTPEGNALAGIQVAGGVYGEWHYWGFNLREPDASVPMRDHFRAWLREKYGDDASLQHAWNNETATLESALVPDMTARNGARDGVFRDAAHERNVIDYLRCQHECVADNIILFARAVKESWPRPIVTGTFYGYFFSTFGRDAQGGHVETHRVLESPWVDYLSAPGAYYPDADKSGDPYRSRGLLESCRLHGKLWLDEMDQNIHLRAPHHEDYEKGVDEGIARVRRNTLWPITKGAGFWYYDFGPSGMQDSRTVRLDGIGTQGWWDAPRVLEDIGRVQQLLEKCFAQPYESQADVLCVYDTESYYHLGREPITHPLNNWMTLGFFRAGVVMDTIYLRDLERVNLDQYRVVVFFNTFLMSEAQRRFVTEKVAQNHRTLVWNYAPAYADGTTNDADFSREVTGFDLERFDGENGANIRSSAAFGDLQWGFSGENIAPLFAVRGDDGEAFAHFEGTDSVAVARKTFPTHTSWFVSLPAYDAALGKTLMRQLPAHRYTDGDDVVYAGGGLLMIHSAQGGPRRVTLRSGQVVEIELAPIDTRVLDSQTGGILL